MNLLLKQLLNKVIYNMMCRTIKIKADFSEKLKENLLLLMKTCSEVFNQHVDWSYENNKSCHKNKAHKDLYDKIRNQFPNLPSGLIQTIRDTSLEAVKANVKKGKQRGRFPMRPRKSETSGVRFDLRCASLRGNLLSISTLGKRERILLSIPKYFQEVFSSWKFKGLQLCYQRNKFFVCLSYEKDTPTIINGDVLGIDRGLKNIVSCSNGFEVSGKTRNRVKRQRHFQRKQLQAKGTRSSKHRQRCLSGREMRFSLNENHVISKEIVNLPYQHFILELLSKMNKKNKGKRFNRKIANWSYFQLEQLLKYKAEALGKTVEYIDPRFTSQRCNYCGHIARKNRNGSEFECEKCGHKDGADLNAAKNIRDLWLEAKNLNPERAGYSQLPECSPNDLGINPGIIPSLKLGIKHWDGTSLQAISVSG
jgi:IS605 OrfB family transposase